MPDREAAAWHVPRYFSRWKTRRVVAEGNEKGYLETEPETNTRLAFHFSFSENLECAFKCSSRNAEQSTRLQMTIPGLTGIAKCMGTSADKIQDSRDLLTNLEAATKVDGWHLSG